MTFAKEGYSFYERQKTCFSHNLHQNIRDSRGTRLSWLHRVLFRDDRKTGGENQVEVRRCERRRLRFV